MEDHQDDALLQRVASEETVLGRGGARNANGKALKVAGLTVLACLLLAGQALTAYLVWGQKEHISALTTGQEKLKAELTRKSSVGAPKMMHVPMNSLPMLKDLYDETSDKTSKKEGSVPLTKLRPIFTNQREGSGQVEASKLMPKMMGLPMRSLPLMVDTDDDVKSSPESAVELESKCKLASEHVMPGFFKPNCDEKGDYLPLQCWHSTGYCWCVDKNGVEIEGSRTRGRPDCSKV